MTNYIDHMSEDPIIPGQNFFLFSYFFTKDNPEIPAMFKFRGAFNTEVEIKERIESLRKSDPYFHIYKADSGKWGSLCTPKGFEILEKESKIKVPCDYNSNKTKNNLFKHEVTMNTLVGDAKEDLKAIENKLEKRSKESYKNIDTIKQDICLFEEKIKEQTEELDSNKLYLEELNNTLKQLEIKRQDIVDKIEAQSKMIEENK